MTEPTGGAQPSGRDDPTSDDLTSDDLTSDDRAEDTLATDDEPGYGESEYAGTGIGHEPYGEAAYGHAGERGDEVATALAGDLAEEYETETDATDSGFDDVAAETAAMHVIGEDEVARQSHVDR
ncbi:MAG: hypothetical protein EPO13_02885 [Actinomycetota bacterium]|nr:MAG: hypothetical protein EPO13_02885 [Actinomycetota bacterium]